VSVERADAPDADPRKTRVEAVATERESSRALTVM
jgi:hypothetical protein